MTLHRNRSTRLKRKVSARVAPCHHGFVTLGAEYIGGVGVPGVCKFTISASAETLGIYGVSFDCSTETLGICGVFSTSTAQNLMTSMV